MENIIILISVAWVCLKHAVKHWPTEIVLPLFAYWCFVNASDAEQQASYYFEEQSRPTQLSVNRNTLYNIEEIKDTVRYWIKKDFSVQDNIEAERNKKTIEKGKKVLENKNLSEDEKERWKKIIEWSESELKKYESKLEKMKLTEEIKIKVKRRLLHKTLGDMTPLSNDSLDDLSFTDYGQFVLVEYKDEQRDIYHAATLLNEKGDTLIPTCPYISFVYDYIQAEEKYYDYQLNEIGKPFHLGTFVNETGIVFYLMRFGPLSIFIIIVLYRLYKANQPKQNPATETTKQEQNK